MPQPPTAPEHDLRVPLLAAAGWGGCLAGLLLPTGPALGLVLLLVLGGVGGRRRPMVAGWCLVAAGLGGHAAMAVDRITSGPVTGWAEESRVVTVELRASSDAVVREGRFDRYTVLRATGFRWQVRGGTVTTRAPVLVVADERWDAVSWGDHVTTVGRLQPAEGRDVAALVRPVGAPSVEPQGSSLLRAAGAVRTSVRVSARDGPGDSDALVPALVTGDDERLPVDVVADFRTAGLTHLTAVSGTNLTLVLVSALLLARWVGVRARGIVMLGLVCVVGFVLVARPEPSVLRAAVMGTVALVGLGTGGRAAGLRALGVAVTLLLATAPTMALSPGFALSVAATAGILLAGPGVRDALAGWLPRWLAEAVAVPWAAQLACTPLVAGLSGQVSLVAVAANLLAAPAVGPATVLGLGGGLVGLLVPPLGRVLGWLAGCAGWFILAVAEQAADLPGAEVAWPTGPVALTALTILSLGLLVVTARVVRHRWWTLGLTLAVSLVVLRPLPTPGWPPPDWVLVMCDVGQGDALALRTGPAEALVVDAGPEPALVDSCLDRLGVVRVPAVVLTHFHADHVDGLAGILDGRAVGEVQVTALREPVSGAALVETVARRHGVPVRVAAYGERVTAGEVRWQVLGPQRVLTGSPNDASLVLLVETGGVRVLLAGDAEPPEQGQLAALAIGEVDVLKVPHHGSRYQDHRFLAALRPRVALVSVGEDNDYGHPATGLVAWLEEGGVDLRRTDEDGDVAVVVDGGSIHVATSARGGP